MRTFETVIDDMPVTITGRYFPATLGNRGEQPDGSNFEIESATDEDGDDVYLTDAQIEHLVSQAVDMCENDCTASAE